MKKSIIVISIVLSMMKDMKKKNLKSFKLTMSSIMKMVANKSLNKANNVIIENAIIIDRINARDHTSSPVNCSRKIFHF